jgi:hypothetical protein
LGNKYQAYIEKQRTEYREQRELNWKVTNYTVDKKGQHLLSLNDLEAFQAQRAKFTTDREAKRTRQREVLLLDFDLYFHPHRMIKSDAQMDYVQAVIDKVLKRNNTPPLTDAYHVDYDPNSLEVVAKLYDSHRLLAVISKQTLDAVQKILVPPRIKGSFIAFSASLPIAKMLVVLALMGLERSCSSRDVYCGRFYGKAYLERCLQIDFPLNKLNAC